jgi:hypothetical protein
MAAGIVVHERVVSSYNTVPKIWQLRPP